MRKQTKKTKEIIQLHEGGKSTSQIAEIYGMKKNTVIQVLRYWDALKESQGVRTEKRVIDYLRKRGLSVKRMGGDNYFDALIGGRLVDIKSSDLVKKGSTQWAYQFELNHSGTKSSINLIDYYLFLFKDSQMLCRMEAKHAKNIKRAITFPPDPFKSRKYPLEFIGYL